MRIWSIHPKYLDPAGLVALWRETLLARAVIRGETRGYRKHPQLDRFLATRDPLAAIDRYLGDIHRESLMRGYQFDESKFVRRRVATRLPVTSGQIEYEWSHLRRKLWTRNRPLYLSTKRITQPEPHPMFTIVAGDIAPWERT